MFGNLWSRIKRTRVVDDRERQLDLLREEVRMSSQFATFMCEAFNRGYSAKLTIEVDGVGCETGLLLSGKEPLMDYLANWACGEMYKKADRLMQFEKADRISAPADLDKDAESAFELRVRESVAQAKKRAVWRDVRFGKGREGAEKEGQE
jgi:hypothetical protein